MDHLGFVFVPKTQFDKTKFYSKPVSRDITLIFGTKS